MAPSHLPWTRLYGMHWKLDALGGHALMHACIMIPCMHRAGQQEHPIDRSHKEATDVNICGMHHQPDHTKR